MLNTITGSGMSQHSKTSIAICNRHKMGEPVLYTCTFSTLLIGFCLSADNLYMHVDSVFQLSIVHANKRISNNDNN